ADCPAAIGRVVNSGSGKEISIGELVDRIEIVLGRRAPVERDEARVRPLASEVEPLCADASLARSLFGWEPRVAVADGPAATAEWKRIAEFDTISLREFPRQRWIRADYHLTGEVDILDEYAARLRDNPLYRDTIFVVMAGLQAHMGNELVGRRLLAPGARVFRF